MHRAPLDLDRWKLALKALIENDRDFEFTQDKGFLVYLCDHLKSLPAEESRVAVQNLITHPAYPVIISHLLDLEYLVTRLMPSTARLLENNLIDNDEEFNRLVVDIRLVDNQYLLDVIYQNCKLAKLCLDRLISKPGNCKVLNSISGMRYFTSMLPIACVLPFLKAYLAIPHLSQQELRSLTNVFLVSLLRTLNEQEIIELLNSIFHDIHIVRQLEFTYYTLSEIGRLAPTYTSQLVKNIHERKVSIDGEFTSLMHATLDYKSLNSHGETGVEPVGKFDYCKDLTMWLSAGDDPNYHCRSYVGQRLNYVWKNDVCEFGIKLLQFGARPIQGTDLLAYILTLPPSKKIDSLIVELMALGVFVDSFNIRRALTIIYEQRPEMINWVRSRGVADKDRTNNRVLFQAVNSFELKLQIKLTEQKYIGRNIFFNLCIALALTKPDHPPFPLTFEMLILVLRLCGLDKTTDECRLLRDACFQQSELLKELIKTPGGINACQKTRTDGTHSFTFFKSATTAVIDYRHLKTKLVKEQSRSLVEVLKKDPYSKATLRQLLHFRNIHADNCLASHESVSGVIQKRLLHNLIDSTDLYREVRTTNACMSDFQLMDEEGLSSTTKVALS